VQISADTVNWTPLKTVTGNTALVNDWTGLNGTGRYLRISGTARGTGYGYSIYELEAYGAGSGGTSNQAPTVALTSPAAKATFTGLAPITLTASAADADGTVGKVEFYAGSTLVGTDSSSPYSVSWTPAVGGTYALTAKATDNAGATTTSVEVSVTVTAATASGQLIPGTIEAESYSAMSGVATETTADTNGGQNVGYIDSSDWLDYAVNVQTAGTYTVQLRVAGFSPTAQLQLKAGNTVLATVNVPNTNGGQNWTTATATISLPAGSQTLRVAVVNGGFNFNWMSFNSGATARTSSALATQAGAAEASDATLAVYPNPAATTVQLSGVAAFPATVAIYDLKGALLQSAQVAQPSDVLSVAELAAGWYVLRVTSKGAVQIQRLLKQ
jgi:hypothetical protein